MRRSMSKQLSFSYGRSLSVLLEEIQKASRSPLVREEIEKVQAALRILRQANQSGVVKSARVKAAIEELLTK